MTIVQDGLITRFPTGEEEVGDVVRDLQGYGFNDVIYTAYELAGEPITTFKLLREVPNLDTYVYFYRGTVMSVEKKGRTTKIMLQGEGTDFFVITCRNMTDLAPIKGKEVIIGYNDNARAFVAYDYPSFENNYIEIETEVSQNQLMGYFRGGKWDSLYPKYTDPFERADMMYQVIPVGWLYHINHRDFIIYNKWKSNFIPFTLIGNVGVEILTHLLPYACTILVYLKDTKKLRLYYCD